MTRNFRNFWIEWRIDGMRNPISSGPQSKDGGFSLTIFQRQRGAIRKALEVHGLVRDSGHLRLEIAPARSPAKTGSPPLEHDALHVRTENGVVFVESTR